MKYFVTTIVGVMLLVIAVFAASPRGGNVEGTLTDPDGRDLSKAKVILYGGSYNWDYCDGMGDYQTVTDADGNFRIANVMTGKYLARVMVPGMGWCDQIIDVDNDNTAPLAFNLSDLKYRQQYGWDNRDRQMNSSYGYYCDGYDYGCW